MAGTNVPSLSVGFAKKKIVEFSFPAISAAFSSCDFSARSDKISGV